MKLSKKIGLILVSGIILVHSLQASNLKCLSQNNTTMVPFRVIGEDLGAKVSFEQASQTITLSYRDTNIELKVGSKKATVNGEEKNLQVAPQVVDGVTYVPIRFVAEALGAEVNYKNGILAINLEGNEKEWKLETIATGINTSSATNESGFINTSKTLLGKNVTMLTINMNDPKVKVKIATAGNKVTRAAAIKDMANGAKASINGTYFAAYNGDVPLPDGTLVSNGRVLHITDIGATIGFTSDNKVLIDFVTTRVQGYINGEEAWTSYRVNRHTADSSATVIYTPEYEGNITLPSGWAAVVCVDGKVAKMVTQAGTVPNNGFILTMTEKRSQKFNVGDSVEYKVNYLPKNTSSKDWNNVIYALSAGPSLMIDGKITGNPSDENFTEAKILTQVARRSFIGTTKDNQLIIGTVSASVSELKNIVKEMGLVSAMCLDGGASSGLYYNGSYLYSPGRNVNNCINFYYS